MKERIKALDGLRFLAAIGVLWIHTWTSYHNPKYYIGKIDLANILAIGGNGVDLFFVISGFCMYYFYALKSDFSYHSFRRFIIKRWVRLSPAFYFVSIIYILIAKFLDHGDFNASLFFMNSLFYTTSIFSQYNIAGQLWTLGVEWQFYLTIPFLLIYQNRIGFKKSFYFIFGALFIIAVISVIILKDRSDILTNQLIFRGVQFGCGIIVGRIIIKKSQVLQNRWLWLILFVIATYSGRIMISRQMLDISSSYYNMFKLLGDTVMGLGFGGLLYLTLTSEKWLYLILGNSLFSSIGKISYSFYLWHSLIPPIVITFLNYYAPQVNGIAAPLLATLISTVILYPIASVSYFFLERPFQSVKSFTLK